MGREQASIVALESAKRKLSEAMDLMDEVWGGDVEFRQANKTAFTRLADAVNLTERARLKVSKAVAELEKVK